MIYNVNLTSKKEEQNINTPDIDFAFKNIRSRNPITQEAGRSYLLAKFEPLIHKLSNQICPTCNKQDMLQSGRLGILKAIESYDASSSFATWCYMQIRNQLQKQREVEHPVKISRFLLKKGFTASYELSLNDQGCIQDPKDKIIQEEDKASIAEALRHINRMFSKKQCKIFTDYYFLNIPLIVLSKRHKLNANAIVRSMILHIRNRITNYNDSGVEG